jgi:hypothetical protein
MQTGAHEFVIVVFDEIGSGPLAAGRRLATGNGRSDFIPHLDPIPGTDKLRGGHGRRLIGFASEIEKF